MASPPASTTANLRNSTGTAAMSLPYSSSGNGSGGSHSAGGGRRASSSALVLQGSLRLPLLEGLVHQQARTNNSSMADAIVQEALQMWQASERIAVWCGHHWKQQRQQQKKPSQLQLQPQSPLRGTRHQTKKRRRTDTRCSSGGEDGVAGMPPSSSSKSSRSTVHWLFQSLQSSSAPERHVACRILAMGCPLDAHSLWQVLEVLVGLLQQSPLPSPSPHTTTSGAPGHSSASSSTPGLVALIKHILLLPPRCANTTTTAPEPAKRKKKGDATSTITNSSSTTTSASNLVLPFLWNKRMGLSWICTTLWKQSVMQEEEDATKQVVSAALVDLLHHLLLLRHPTTSNNTSRTTTSSSEPSQTSQEEVLEQAHAFLWKSSCNEDNAPSLSVSSSSSAPLSPLACLLATQLVWKQRKHELHPAQKDVLHVLKQLLDPHTTVPTRKRNSSNNNSSKTGSGLLGSALESLLHSGAAAGGSGPSVPPSLWALANSSLPPRRLMDTIRPPVDATTAAIAEALTQSPARNKNNSNYTSTLTTRNLPPGPPPLFGAGDTAGSHDSSPDQSATAAAVARIFSAVYGPSSGSAGAGTSSSSTLAQQQALEPLSSGGAGLNRRTASGGGRTTTSSTATTTVARDGASGAASTSGRTSAATSPSRGRQGTVSSRDAQMDIDGHAPHSDEEEDDNLFHDSGEEDEDDDDDDDDGDVEDRGRRRRTTRHAQEEEEDEEDEDEILQEGHSEDEEEDHEQQHADDHEMEEDHDEEEEEEHEVEEGEHPEDEDEEHEASHPPHHNNDNEVEELLARTDRNKEDDDDDEDEEIDSDEDDDEEDCEFDNDDDAGGGSSGEHDIVIHEEHDDDEDEDDIAGFRQRLMDLHDGGGEDEDRPATGGASSSQAPGCLAERKLLYLKAGMRVLATQYATTGPHSLLSYHHRAGWGPKPAIVLPIQAEHDLMNNILNIVKPPKKPVNAKIILRRAPTQEDFFRGALSKNPISLNQLRKDNNREPTVKDLRQYIADDLQMSDSAELLELLVANKIIDVELKLRVVHQVVWKRHLIQSSSVGGGLSGSNATSALSSLLGGGGRGVTRSLITGRSGLSMIFSTSSLPGASTSDANGNAITEETPLSALSPMVVTYRLTGVDGEATEDTVTSLEDPDAPSGTADPEQKEKMMEKEFGMTRLVTEGRGVNCLLKSVERNINDTLRKIRRDDIGGGDNLSRAHFKTCSPYPGLTLLSYCAKLASNRKLLLQSRAPTILLRLLLDVLHALEDGLSESNPTAKGLQELIEILATDMLSLNGVKDVDDVQEEDASTLRLLLSAIETSSLSRPLRNVIAKLLPYLTYGQSALSKELALEFVRNVDLQHLGEYEQKSEDYSQVLMATFVHASTSLPANDVCNTLRTELIQCGYVERIASFLLENCPSEPPSWTPSLWAKGDQLSAKKKTQLEKQWRNYIPRPGLLPAFDMLIGLSKDHRATQGFVGNIYATSDKELSLLQLCHWIEATSDNSSSRVPMNGLGLVAETLLDELASEGSPVAVQVKTLRTNTRNRKKEIAMARRSKALVSMGTFGAKKASASPKSSDQEAGHTGVRGTAASFLAPVLGLFQNTDSSQPPPTKRRKKDSCKGKEDEPSAKPAWMTEMENMEDETGLTCAVCQEGRTLQPSELLGLYAYVKKISVPLSQCGGRNHIDGTALLTALPPSMPSSLADSHAATEWFPAAHAAGEDLKESSRSSLASVASSRRATYFTTTVSAGNAIHINCHNRARQADRNHPKAPKSEWEGASLRNSRVNCNVIMPLVSSRSSKVPLVAVDVALTEHQTAVSNLLGARPKSMLWNILHDVRFLVLRMAYGEPLNADCGGGSLASNSQLIFHQLLMADMFEKDAQVDAPEMAQHARNLSAGFLAASAITQADDFDKRNQTLLHRGIADSAAMASLTCILFHNTKDDYGASAASTSSDVDERPHPKRRWVVGRDYFLRGLLNCAGRRHALGVEGSGCTTNRSVGSKRRRPAGFADWDIVEEDDAAGSASLIRSHTASIDDFKDALRPMIVYFALMDQLSEDFVLSLDDMKVEELATRLVQVIKDCHSCKSIHELLQKARVSLEPDEIIEELQKGMMAA